MADKVHWLPNIRVDIEDLDQSTHGYGGELDQENNKRILKDNYPRVVEGFRVEISDAANREITVYNGVAIDGSGKLVTNEEVVSTARSITLSGDATYYIEVEFTENLGSTDARAFWDPTFDNGLDTSGDVLPDGRESPQNVATRKTSDWQIINPPSTTGFEVSTTPSTDRIPVAIITVFGGSITEPTGVGPARTTFARSYAVSASSIRVVNSRIFPNTFDARLGSGAASQEDISVIANDRENGILTLSAPTANAHDVGERILNFTAAAPVFVDQRVTYDGPIATTAGDARLRLFQGDAEAGFSLSKDPDDDTGESDVQVGNLKNYVDFLASQILEIKFGSGTGGEIGVAGGVGNTAPPTAWSSTMPNFYESAGGLQGARTNTVSVGNGTTTWGDFNLTNAGSAQEALQAAVDALPSTGGIVYIKSGTYDIVDTGVTCDKPIMIMGNPGSTTVRSTGTAAAFTFTANAISVGFKNISVVQSGGTADYCIVASGEHAVYTEGCTIGGIDSSGTGIRDSAFICTTFDTASAGICINGWLQAALFSRCKFDNSVLAAGSRLLNLSTAQSLSFRDCRFLGNSTQNFQIDLPATALRILFDGCRFTEAGGTVVAFNLGVGVSTFKVNNCIFETSGGVGVFNAGSDIRFSGCTVDVPQNDSALIFEGNASEVCLTDCFFTQETSSSMTTGAGLDLADVTNCSVTACSFIDCDYGIYMDDPSKVLITSCKIQAPTTGRGRAGIFKGTNGAAGTTSWNDVAISNCTITTLTDSSTNNYGIYCEYTTTTDEINDVAITGCIIETIGAVNGSTSTAGGIVFTETSQTGFAFSRPTITGNMVRNIEATNTVIGISVEGGSNARVANNTVSSSAQVIAVGAVSCQGIQLFNTQRAAVSSNTVFAMGNSGQTLTFRGVIVEGDNNTQCTDVTIANNTVSDVDAGAGGSIQGIRVGYSGTEITITGNVVSMGANSSTNRNGITVSSNQTAVLTGAIVISGNIVKGDVEKAIRVSLTANGGKEEGVVVTGNWVSDFHEEGICVQGHASDHIANLSISGNNVRSIFAILLTKIGIYVKESTYVTISGNSISLINQSDYGILAVDTRNVSLCGNSVYISDGIGAEGVRFDTVVDCMVSGNTIRLNDNGSGYCLIGNSATRAHAGNNLLVNSQTTYILGFAEDTAGAAAPGFAQATYQV